MIIVHLCSLSDQIAMETIQANPVSAADMDQSSDSISQISLVEPQTNSKTPQRIEEKEYLCSQCHESFKAPNGSESTFFFTRRVLKCLSSAQLAVKASATSYPKGNISLNIELNESSNAMVACGVSLRCKHSKNIPVAGLVVLTKLQKNMAMHQDLLNATSVTRPLLERIPFLLICRFTPK